MHNGTGGNGYWSGDWIVDLKRGDYVQFEGGHLGSVDNWSAFCIEKLS